MSTETMDQKTPEFLRVLNIFLNPNGSEGATGVQGDPVWAAKIDWDKMSEPSACATTCQPYPYRA